MSRRKPFKPPCWPERGSLLDLGENHYVEVLPKGYALCETQGAGLCFMRSYDTLKEALEAFYAKTKNQKAAA